jgi:ketosteroid isomerase-like protein
VGESVPRSHVEAFYRALGSRDTAQLDPFLDDDVLWINNGPVELLRFCGERRGKAAVLDLYGRVGPSVYKITGFEPEIMVIDGDRCATLGRIKGVKDDGRAVSYRVTQFLRFRGGKVVENRAVIDSFNAVEQVVGPLLGTPEPCEVVANGKASFVAV